MIFLKVFQITLPVFLIIAAGYFFGFFKRLSLDATSEIVLYLTSPCLAFTALVKSGLKGSEIFFMGLADFWVVLFLGLFIFLLLKNTSFKKWRWIYLPVLFMNSGNLGFPLATLFYGERGLALAIIFNLFNAILLYSLGVVIANNRENFWEFLKMPYFYAVLAAVVFNLINIEIPAVIFNPLLIVGNLTIPLMLLALGSRLHDFKAKYFFIALGPSLLRIFGGFILALIFVKLFSVSGMARQIIILLASLPAALSIYIISEKYNFYPEEVASTVTVSNLLGVIFIPLIIWAINL